MKRVHARRIRRRREEEDKCLWCRECEKDEGGGEEGRRGRQMVSMERITYKKNVREGGEEERPNMWRREWTHEGEGRRGAMPVAERVDT